MYFPFKVPWFALPSHVVQLFAPTPVAPDSVYSGPGAPGYRSPQISIRCAVLAAPASTMVNAACRNSCLGTKQASTAPIVTWNAFRFRGAESTCWGAGGGPGGAAGGARGRAGGAAGRGGGRGGT